MSDRKDDLGNAIKCLALGIERQAKMFRHIVRALASTIDAQPPSNLACGWRQETPPTVLIVGDDATCCQIVSYAAEARGCIPVQAQSHEHADSFLRQRLPDCVTLDLGSDGHWGDLLDAIRRHDAKLPVLIISDETEGGHCHAIELARRYGLNICPTLLKPLVMADLLLAFTFVRMLTLIGGVSRGQYLEQAQDGAGP